VIGNVVKNKYTSPIGKTTADGIACNGGCLISGNTVHGYYDGIGAGPGSLVFGNSISGNAFGIYLTLESGYGKNVMENNATACLDPSSQGTSTGDNICNGVRQ
jgi:hypothetical protein